MSSLRGACASAFSAFPLKNCLRGLLSLWSLHCSEKEVIEELLLYQLGALVLSGSSLRSRLAQRFRFGRRLCLQSSCCLRRAYANLTQQEPCLQNLLRGNPCVLEIQRLSPHSIPLSSSHEAALAQHVSPCPERSNADVHLQSILFLPPCDPWRF